MTTTFAPEACTRWAICCGLRLFAPPPAVIERPTCASTFTPAAPAWPSVSFVFWPAPTISESPMTSTLRPSRPFPGGRLACAMVVGPLALVFVGPPFEDVPPGDPALDVPPPPPPPPPPPLFEDRRESEPRSRDRLGSLARFSRNARISAAR